MEAPKAQRVGAYGHTPLLVDQGIEYNVYGNELKIPAWHVRFPLGEGGVRGIDPIGQTLE